MHYFLNCNYLPQPNPICGGIGGRTDAPPSYNHICGGVHGDGDGSIAGGNHHNGDGTTRNKEKNAVDSAEGATWGCFCRAHLGTFCCDLAATCKVAIVIRSASIRRCNHHEHGRWMDRSRILCIEFLPCDAKHIVESSVKY